MENKTNGWLVVLSVIVPIVGYVLYFVKRSECNEVAKTYLWTAVAGTIVNFIVEMALFAA